jgi:hypothetical protein
MVNPMDSLLNWWSGLTASEIGLWISGLTLIATVVGVWIAWRRPRKAQSTLSQNNTGAGQVNSQAGDHSQVVTINLVNPAGSPADEPAAAPALLPEGRIFGITRLPNTKAFPAGRAEELKILDTAWADPHTSVLVLEAMGGMGKSLLLRTWVERFIQQPPAQAEWVYCWSFYSQGSAQDRQVSAEPFLRDALACFGYQGEVPDTAHDQGQALAHLIESRRVLLVLDGLEPLQQPPGPAAGGTLRDQGLIALLGHLALRNTGLVLISSRQPVVELAQQPQVTSHQLAPLDAAAAAELFRQAKVNGTAAEYAAARDELHGHALSLQLLATYLREYAAGDIRRRDQLPILLDFPEERAEVRHAMRLMQAHLQCLEGTADQAILWLLGLFDRPVAPEVVDVLRRSEIATLQPLRELDQQVYPAVLQRLQAQGLLNADATATVLDTHPLIRQYVAYHWQTKYPDDWQAAHQVLFAYYQAVPEQHQPDTLQQLEPLFAAVRHGCLAGLHQQALEEVYVPRIRRDSEISYLTKRLGAFSTDLALLAYFFAQPWQQPVPGLTAAAQAVVLNWAAFRLRALGRLAEAVAPFRAGLDRQVIQQDWRNVAIATDNLSALQLTLGEVAAAVQQAKDAVAYADRSKNWQQRMTKRTTWADALGQSGAYRVAGQLFVAAEQLQQPKQSEYPCLYSVWGYRYGVWWLAAGAWSEAQTRATQTLELATQFGWLLDIALGQLLLGRAKLQQALAEVGLGATPSDPPPESVPLAPDARLLPAVRLSHRQRQQLQPLLQQAQDRLVQSVQGLRQAGTLDHLSRGLLARAAAARYIAALWPAQQEEAWSQAADDLREVEVLATRCGMKLFLVDYHLEAARWALTWPELWSCASESDCPDWAPMNQLSAAAHVERAAALMADTGYAWPQSALAHLRQHL